MSAAKLRLRRVSSLRDRVNAMNDLVRIGLKDPEVRRLALAVAGGDKWTVGDIAEKRGAKPFDVSELRSANARDDEGELRNIFFFTRSNVRYTGDIAGVDTYTSAFRTLFDYRAGDCDDHYIVNATLAIHNGFGFVARCIAGVRSRDASGRPAIGHIYGVALVPKWSPSRGIAMDSTYGDLGEEPPKIRQVDYRSF